MYSSGNAQIHVYYVTPNLSVACPGDPCFNFTTYVQDPLMFHSNSTYIFLPGVHHVDIARSVVFKSLDNLQLNGWNGYALLQKNISMNVQLYGFDPFYKDESVQYYESSAQILCDHPSSLTFVNISNLIISNLTILNCGSNFNYNGHYSENCSVCMQNVTNLILDSVSIQNGTGFGLLGINVLGVANITACSFVGNNQFVKDMLQKNVTEFPCQSTGTVFVNDGSLNSSSVVGGNAYFQYTNDFPAIIMNKLVFFNCLFSLGVDGSLFSDPFATSSCHRQHFQSGTGLTIIMAQSLHNVNVTIGNTVFYRNQAGCGANVYFYVSGVTNKAHFALHTLSSLYSAGYFCALFYFDEELSSLLNVTNSTFECNHDLGSIGIFATAHIADSKFNDSNFAIIGTADFSHCQFIETEGYISNSLMSYAQCSFLKSVFVIYYQTNSSYTDCQFTYSAILLLGLQYSSYKDCDFSYSSIDAIFDSVIMLSGHTTFRHNSRQSNGGAIFLYSSTMVLEHREKNDFTMVEM